MYFFKILQYEPPDEGSHKKSDIHSLLTNGNVEKEHRPKKEKESIQPSHNKKPPKSHKAATSSKGASRASSPGGRKSKTKKERPTTIDQLNSRRRKLYAAILKKEISKGQKARNFNQKERINNKKRIAVQCMRAVRQKAMMSQRFTKETLSRAKRLTREMQNHWKKHDRIDKQEKRKLEKEVISMHLF